METLTFHCVQSMIVDAARVQHFSAFIFIVIMLYCYYPIIINVDRVKLLRYLFYCDILIINYRDSDHQLS